MKILLIYYSHTGNTDKVASTLEKKLEKTHSVNRVRLKPEKEAQSFIGQCLRAFFKRRSKLFDVPYDVSEYDILYLGTPVWAFSPVPAVLTYLDKVYGLDDKKAVVFTTYGSGTGNQKCLQEMVEMLKGKGVSEVKKFSVSQKNIGDVNYISGLIPTFSS